MTATDALAIWQKFLEGDMDAPAQLADAYLEYGAEGHDTEELAERIRDGVVGFAPPEFDSLVFLKLIRERGVVIRASPRGTSLHDEYAHEIGFVDLANPPPEYNTMMTVYTDSIAGDPAAIIFYGPGHSIEIAVNGAMEAEANVPDWWTFVHPVGN